MAKTTKKTAATEVVVNETNEYEKKYNELKSLNQSLIKEIDNVFMSRLTPGALGSVLGKVIKNFNLQMTKIDQTKF